MRIGILSDTHDKLSRTIEAIELLASAGAEALFHCGDLTGPDVVRACEGLPTYFVFGNNDTNAFLLRRVMVENNGTCLEEGGVVTLAGKRLAMTHGHLNKEIHRLERETPDYLLYGHSHQADDRQEGPTRWINPGALHRAHEYTVALLDLVRDDLRFLKLTR